MTEVLHERSRASLIRVGAQGRPEQLVEIPIVLRMGFSVAFDVDACEPKQDFRGPVDGKAGGRPLATQNELPWRVEQV